MAKMNQDELLTYLNTAEANTIHADDNMNADNKRFYDYYDGAPWNEVDDESKVISTDVYDVIESMMPSLVQVFLGVNEIHKFTAINETPRERQIAEEKTKYINHLVRNQPTSYKTIFDWLKGAEIYRYSAVTFGYEEEDTVKIEEYANLTEDEASETKIALNLMVADGAEVEVEDVERDENDDLFDLKATIKKTVGRYFFRYINPEDFTITSGATSEDDAELIGHDDYITKAELVAMGYSQDLVRDLPNTDASNSTNRDNRLRDQGGAETGNSSQWFGEIVKLQTRCMKVDMDGDGVAERLRILKVGETILESEPYDCVPYAVLSSILMPGQLIGKSHAEVTTETQDIKTTLLRQTMMNMYQVNSARMAANSNVNMDDLLTQRLGGVVRVKGDGNPLQSMAPLPVPFIADKALMVIQYADSARAQRTGTIPGNQALDSDKLGKETATRFDGVQDAANSKIELVARGHAETGFRKLFMGMLWTVTHFQKTATEVMVLGKQLTVDPRKWLSDQPMVCNVGLAAGDNENVLSNMSGLLQITQQLLAVGSPLSDQKKMYNILSRMTKAMEEGNVGEFFNDPEIPEQVLQAENEQLKQVNQQMEQQLQTNPLAEAAMVEQQGKIAIAQGNLALKEAELQEKVRQFNISELADSNKTIAELEQKYTELELKYNTDIAGQGQ